MSFINFHTQIFESTEPENRLTSDLLSKVGGIFETVLLHQNSCPFLRYHFERMQAAAQVFKYDFPLDFKQFESVFFEFLKQSKLENARIRIHLFKSEKGETSLVPTAEPFILSENLDPQTVAFSTLQLPFSKVSKFKKWKFAPYLLATQEASSLGVSQTILCNENGWVADATYSNIFFIKNDKIFTPNLESGAVEGVMRKIFISDFKVEEISVSEEMLFKADEIFLTNALRGIISVEKLEQKIFLENKKAKEFQHWFLEKINAKKEQQ